MNVMIGAESGLAFKKVPGVRELEGDKFIFDPRICVRHLALRQRTGVKQTGHSADPQGLGRDTKRSLCSPYNFSLSPEMDSKYTV